MSFVQKMLALCLLLFILTSQAFFQVSQQTQVLVLQLGRLVRTLKAPGLYLKIPFVQETIVYDKRILALDVPPTEVTLGDQKRAIVDIFLRYRISDPERFYKTVRHEEGAQLRLTALVSGILRSTLGKKALIDLLSSRRADIMEQISKRSNTAMLPLGIEVIDVRIRRADLPPANSLAIFSRMISERHKEAREIRAHGQERQQVIKSNANLEGELILSEAIQKAGAIRGEGLQKAQAIFREAYAQDPAFAAFYQSLEAYKEALSSKTRYVLTPEQSFLRFFQNTPSKVKKS